MSGMKSLGQRGLPLVSMVVCAWMSGCGSHDPVAQPEEEAPAAELSAQIELARRHFRSQRDRFVATNGQIDVAGEPSGALRLYPSGSDRGAVLQTSSVGAATPMGRWTRHDAGFVERGWGTGTERLQVTKDGVEQTWHFDAPPEGDGALEVRVEMDPTWSHSGDDADGHLFQDGEATWRYGNATWLDATGTATALDSRVEDKSVLISVPEAVLAASTYPAVLDPVIRLVGALPVRYGPAAGRQTAPAIGGGAYDGGEIFLAVWQDNHGDRLLAARVDAEQTLIDPVPLVLDFGTNPINPVVTFDGSYFVVAWEYDGPVDRDIAVVAIDPPTLSVSPYTIVTAAGDQRRPTLASGNDETIVAWEDERSGLSDIWGRRVVPGVGPLGFEARLTSRSSILPFDASNNYARRPKIVYAPAVDRYMLFWEQASGPATSTSDIYSTRVWTAPFGSPAPLGALVSTAAAPGSESGIGAVSRGREVLVVWGSQLTPDPNPYLAKARRYDGLLGVPAGAPVAVFADPLNDIDVSYNANADEYVIAAAGNVLAGPGAILARRVLPYQQALGRPDLGFLAPVDGVELGLGSAMHTTGRFGMTAMQHGHMFVYTDGRYGPTQHQIFAGRVSPDLTHPFQGQTHVSVEFNVTGVRTAPSLAVGTEQSLVVWSDEIAGQSDIVGLFLNGDGEAAPEATLPIAFAEGENTMPVVGTSGSDFFVAWVHDDTVGSHAAGRFVTANGTLVDNGGDPIDVSDSLGTVGARIPTDVAWDGDAYVVPYVTRGSSPELRAARITVSAIDRGAICTTLGSEPFARVASNGGGEALIVWDDSGSIQGTTLVATGPGSLCGSSFASGHSPDISAMSGSDYMLTWVDGGELRAGSFDTSGSAASDFQVYQSTGEQPAVPRIEGDGTDWLVVWESRIDEYREVFGREVFDTDVHGDAFSVAPDASSPTVGARTGRNYYVNWLEEVTDAVFGANILE